MAPTAHAMTTSVARRNPKKAAPTTRSESAVRRKVERRAKRRGITSSVTATFPADWADSK